MTDPRLHPSDLELADLIDGALDPEARRRVAGHLEDCLACRVRITNAGGPVPVPKEMPSEWPDAAVSASLVELFRAAETPPEERGQLWRLEWEGQAEMALLWAVEGRSARIFPVTEDPELGDEQTIRVDPVETELGIPLGVWVGLETTVPRFVLDRCLGAIEGLERAVEPIRLGSTEVNRTSGLEISSPLDERLSYRSDLENRLSGLSEAEWVPESHPLEESIAALLRQVGPNKVAEALGADVRVGLSVVLRKRPTSTEETRTLKELTGWKGEPVSIFPPPDPSLVEELDRPTWRAKIKEKAREWSETERDGRRRVAYELLPAAARSTGTDTTIDWGQLVADYFDE